MSHPLFSVIIPTLNEEKFLPRLLRALARQTYRDFEVIVVDGKSSDNTLEVAKGFTQKIPKLTLLTCHDRNVGLQRNKGAGISKGSYLVFFDADVQIPPSFLKQIAGVINSRKSLFITTWHKPDTRAIQDMAIIAVANISIETANILEQPFVAGFDIIIHKALFDTIGGFNTKLKHSEDHELAQRCLKAGVKLTVLRRPRLIASNRRFRKFGYFAIVRQYATNSMYILLRKHVTKALGEYPMGGHLYNKQERTRQIGLVQLEKFLMKQMEKIGHALD